MVGYLMKILGKKLLLRVQLNKGIGWLVSYALNFTLSIPTDRLL